MLLMKSVYLSAVRQILIRAFMSKLEIQKIKKMLRESSTF